MRLDPDHILQLAQAELVEERLREAVQARKQELQRARWWRRWFPFSISIVIKKEKV